MAGTLDKNEMRTGIRRQWLRCPGGVLTDGTHLSCAYPLPPGGAGRQERRFGTTASPSHLIRSRSLPTHPARQSRGRGGLGAPQRAPRRVGRERPHRRFLESARGGDGRNKLEFGNLRQGYTDSWDLLGKSRCSSGVGKETGTEHSQLLECSGELPGAHLPDTTGYACAGGGRGGRRRLKNLEFRDAL